jgi:hypothetical protein
MRWGTIPAGSVAGSLGQEGYRVINFKRKIYLAHRVIWVLMTGEQPPDLLDHRDTDRANLRWANLRPATVSLNGANARQKSGHKKGARKRGRRFVSTISFQGRSIYIGSFASEDEAHAAYLAKAKELFGEFARAA